MGIDKKAGGSIQRAKGKIHRGTGPGSAGPKQKNEDGSGCIRLCNWGSVIYGVWE